MLSGIGRVVDGIQTLFGSWAELEYDDIFHGIMEFTNEENHRERT